MWLGKHWRKLVRMMREGMKRDKYKGERENMVGKSRITEQCKEREKENVNINARQSKKVRKGPTYHSKRRTLIDSLTTVTDTRTDDKGE